MEDQLISFETAKLAKNVGFNINCGNYYRKWYDDIRLKLGSRWWDSIHEDNPPNEIFYLAPTQSLLQKWLRENHDIKVCISWTQFDGWLFEINFTEGGISGFDTYEEALEKGLQESLKLLR